MARDLGYRHPLSRQQDDRCTLDMLLGTVPIRGKRGQPPAIASIDDKEDVLGHPPNLTYSTKAVKHPSVSVHQEKGEA